MTIAKRVDSFLVESAFKSISAELGNFLDNDIKWSALNGNSILVLRDHLGKKLARKY